MWSLLFLRPRFVLQRALYAVNCQVATSSMLISLLRRESSLWSQRGGKFSTTRPCLSRTKPRHLGHGAWREREGGKNWLIPDDFAFIRDEVSSLYPWHHCSNTIRIYPIVESIIFTNAKPPWFIRFTLSPFKLFWPTILGRWWWSVWSGVAVHSPEIPKLRYRNDR